MTTFKDAGGKKRSLIITFRTLFQCAEIAGFDLLNPTAEVENSGRVLSDELMYNSRAMAMVLYAFCREDGETQDEFFGALDGRAFKDGEEAFWKEYRDFFIQSGRDWLAVALEKDLQTRAIRLKAAKEGALNFNQPIYSDSSTSPDDKTGSTAPTGNSQDLPTPPTSDAPTKSASSSAESTTPTRVERKTSNARRTSTPTK